MAAHLALSAVLGIFVAVSVRRGGDYTIRALLAVTVTATGPFGAGGTLLCLAMHRVYARTAQPADQWLDELLGDSEPAVAGQRSRAALSSEIPGSAGEVTSLIDALEMGDELQKQSVVSLVTRSFRPSLAPVLRRALADPSNSIRVQAATAMARIEGGFLERTMEIDRRLAKNPADVAAVKEAARLYDDYAFTGILDPAREQANQEQAIRHYRRCVEIDAGDQDARLALGRLLVRSGQWAEADTCLAAAGEEGALWRLETLNHLGRFDELERVARTVRTRAAGDDLLPLAVREAVELWAGEQAA
jgi:tetratricopeptide (TPR) repeat protein